MNFRTVLRCELLEDWILPSVTFQFDYSLDTGNFFNTQEKKDLLELAGQLLTSRLGDSLAAIVPGGINRWTASIFHPSTGASLLLDNPTVPADTIIVYVGGRSLTGSEVGEAGPGGYSASGSSEWLNLVEARGQSGALGPRGSRTDFAPAIGAMSFDTGTNWYFNASPAGLPAHRIDFLSVAVHELGHILGYGTSDSWRNQRSGSTFVGAASIAEYGGPVPLNADRSHWAGGVQSNGATAAMTPSLMAGEAQRFTPLDFAGLDDIGWQVLPAIGFNVSPSYGLITTKTGGTASFTVNLTSIPTANVTVTLNSSNPQTGTPSTTLLTFTPANALIPQRVTVTGLDDGLLQHVAYTIVLDPAVSADPEYNGRDPDDVAITNLYIPPPPPPPPPQTPDNSTAALDVTAFIEVVRLRLRRRGARDLLTLRLLHRGDRILYGPFSVLFHRLRRGVKLRRPAGTAQRFDRPGSLYAEATVGALSPGEAVDLVLEFANPTRQPLQFAARVIAGPGLR